MEVEKKKKRSGAQQAKRSGAQQAKRKLDRAASTIQLDENEDDVRHAYEEIASVRRKRCGDKRREKKIAAAAADMSPVTPPMPMSPITPPQPMSPITDNSDPERDIADMLRPPRATRFLSSKPSSSSQPTGTSASSSQSLPDPKFRGSIASLTPGRPSSSSSTELPPKQPRFHQIWYTVVYPENPVDGQNLGV